MQGKNQYDVYALGDFDPQRSWVYETRIYEKWANEQWVN